MKPPVTAILNLFNIRIPLWGILPILCLAVLLSGCAGHENQSFAPGEPKQFLPADTPAVPAPEKVRFPSLDADINRGVATMIGGELFKPAGRGPFPAIVALHGCSGLYTPSGQLRKRDSDWARRLQRLGYLVLLPDSLTPRGFREICTRRDTGQMPFRERPRDAYGALKWLQSQTFVSQDRIGLMGWSNGGSTVLATVDAASATRPAGREDFRTAIAFYPGCLTIIKKTGWTPRIPLIILIGEADDWTPAAPCVTLAENACQSGASLEIVTYPDAHHGFDDPDSPLTTRRGLARTARGDGSATVGTNAPARADAIGRVQRLLERHLGKAVDPAAAGR